MTKEKAYIIMALCVIAIIVLFVIRALVKRAIRADNSNGCRATGCDTSMACQYMDLGKAKDAGYDTTVYCYCKAKGQLVPRTDECPEFYPHGCANGMCSYAKHTAGRCYCELYEQNVDPRESCQDYLIGLVIANVIALIMFLIEKSKVDAEQSRYDQIYNQKKAADAKRVAEERKIKARLETLRDKLSEQHDDTVSTLRKYYNAGPIYSKYHNINAICSFYEYFMSGRCTELQGHEGAYNIYESEARMDRIICKLDDVLANLEQIKDNQHMLYTAISEGNRKIDNLIEETNRQTNALNYIGEQTAIAAYNTEQARQEAAQIKWLKTYEVVQRERHDSW